MIIIKLDPQKTGLALGSFAALVHLVWIILVATELAQECMDWIYSMHFKNNPFTVLPFDLTTGVILLVTASIVGFVAGWLFATIWNYWQKK